MSKLALNATMAKFVAQREEARAILMLYATQAVGIADHSDIIGEMTAWTKKLAEAEECISTLQKAFPSQPQEE